MKNKTKPIRLWLLCLSFLFLFNPNLIVVDLLPDFIGYLLLCAALVRLSDLNGTIEEAVSGFKKMTLIDGAKWIAIVWIFGISEVDEQTSSMLLWSTVFCILELIFAIPAFSKLFSGLSALGDFHENTSIHGSKVKRNGKRKRVNYTDSAKRLTVLLVCAKAILAFLPELADFGNVARRMREHGDMLYDPNKVFFNPYDYIGLFRGAAFIVTLVIGILWLVRIIRYFVRIKKDTQFIDGLSDTYESRVSTKVGIFINRYVKVGFQLLGAGMLLTLDFRLEDVNMIPDLISGAILFAFALYMARRIGAFKAALVGTSAAYLVAACLSSYFEYSFFSNHTYMSILWNDDASSAYWTFVVAVALSGIILALLWFFVAKALKHIIVEHTGYVLGSQTGSEVEARQIRALHKELYTPVIYASVALGVYIVTDILSSLYVYLYAYLEENFGYLAAINTVVGLVFFGLLLKALGEIRDAVKIKYMLE